MKMNKAPILPPATIGIIGGGQLGQMLAQSAKTMGYHVGILDPIPDCPAAQVSDFQIIAAYDDQVALKKLANKCALLTYEFENVSLIALETLKNDVSLPQGLRLLAITQNRLVEKNFLRANDIPTVPFTEIQATTDLTTVGAYLPGILKTTVGGYDGHGQVDIANTTMITAHAQLYQQAPAILEKRLAFVQEISVMVTQDGLDQVHIWPIAENKHEQHVLKTSLIPAQVSPKVALQVTQIATKLAKKLDLRGVLGVEMFVTADEQVLVNELAPRPHNSGHYSIEAMNVSQFEGHIRSITNLPIAPLKLYQPALMVNLLGEQLTHARNELSHHPEWHFHDYGKAQIRPLRKLGHITVIGTNAINHNKNWLKTDK
ncbi:5-(carboxyamino)imidazole ribonucleotide synthase [Weissella beninensis]|nr:5-(carboxyamino)imidazole ribonucleotide synthase [Periweissella beninensis]